MKLIAPLFDFSFSNFITTKIVRFMYALIVIIGAVAATFMFASLLIAAPGSGGKLGALILGPPMIGLGFLLFVAWARISLEMTIVLFRIAENVQHISERRPEPSIGMRGTSMG